MRQFVLFVGLLFVAFASARVAKHHKHREQALELEPVEEVLEEYEQEPPRRQNPRVTKDNAVFEEEQNEELELTQEAQLELAEEPTEAPVKKHKKPHKKAKKNKPHSEVPVETIQTKQSSVEPVNTREHPCNSMECEVGEECVLDKKENAKCVCIKKCEVDNDERFKVCTKSNDTMSSMCEMERQICLCKKGKDSCINPHFMNAEIDYYGPCKDMDAEAKACTKYEKSQFPLRMRKWLFIVMEELAGRNDLDQKAKKMARKAEHMKESNKKDVTHKWMIPVIWKFCDLDVSHDEIIAPLEHIPISAPLKPLEHCLSPFLQECDTDNDENISKREWLECLKLQPEEIDVRCEEFRSDE